MPVTGTTVDVVDIKGTGYDPYDPVEDMGGAHGEINIQLTDDLGYTQEENYFWYDFSYVDEDSGETVVIKGWLNGDDEPVERGTCTIVPGEGFMMKTEVEGFSLQSAGEVLTDADQPVELRENLKLIANPTPVTVDLADCYVTGYDPYDPVEDMGGAHGEVNAQKTDDLGYTQEENYFWYDFSYVDEDSGETVVVYGWLDGDDESIVRGDCTVDAGLGLLTKCEADGFNFVWPKVEIAK